MRYRNRRVMRLRVASPRRKGRPGVPALVLAVTVRVLISGLLLATLGYGLWAGAVRYVMNAPDFRVREVRIEGAPRGIDLSREKIKAIFLGKNLFFVDTDRAGRMIRSYVPEVQELVITKEYPDTVSVTFDLREPVMQVAFNRFYLVDKDGVIFRNAIDRPLAGMPVIRGMNERFLRSVGTLYRTEQMRAALALVRALRENNYFTIYPAKTIQVRDPQNLCFYLTNGLEIRIGGDDFASRLTALEEILRTRRLNKDGINCIDVRFGDVIVEPRKG